VQELTNVSRRRHRLFQGFPSVNAATRLLPKYASFESAQALHRAQT